MESVPLKRPWLSRIICRALVMAGGLPPVLGGYDFVILAKSEGEYAVITARQLWRVDRRVINRMLDTLQSSLLKKDEKA